MEGSVSRRSVLVSATASAAAFVLAACGGGSTSGNGSTSGSGSGAGGSAAGGSTRFSVGVIPIVDVAPVYLGVQKGFFSSRGLEVTPQPAQGGAAVVPAVLSGENLVGFSNVVSLLTAREKGVPLVSIAAGVSSTGDPANDLNGVMVSKTSTLRTAKDLEGKKVAVNSLNNIGDATVKVAVTKAGGDPKAVTFVEVPMPTMPAQLAAGTVDAAWITEPFRTQVLTEGGRILFDSLTETHPTLQVSHWFTTVQAKKEKAREIEAFVAGINESMVYAEAHPDEVRAVLATYTKISPDVVAKMALPKWPTALDRESLTVVGEAARTYGTLTKAPDVAGLLGG